MFNFKLVAAERVSILEDFQSFLIKRGINYEEDVTKNHIQDYIIEKRSQSGEIKNIINVIHQYFHAAKNDFLSFEAGAHLDSDWHYRRISELAKNELGEDVWRQVFGHVQMPEIGWTLDELASFTRQMYQDLSKVASPEQIQNIMHNHAHGSDVSHYSELRDVLKAKGIDGLLKHMCDDLIQSMEECHAKGELWWATEVDEDVINYLKKNPLIYRDGNKIINKKVLCLPKRYLNETDEKMKRYYACHCSLKRQSILQDEGGLSNSLCYCCLGYDKKQFEAAFGRELTGRVLQSVMDEGCLECIFEIDIPNETLNVFPNVMVINMPKFRAISSGWQMEDDLYNGEDCFYGWIIKRKHLHKEAFLGSTEFFIDSQMDVHGAANGLLFAVHDDVTASDAAPYEIMDIKGGLYAALWCPAGNLELEDMMYPTIMKWVENSKFEHDTDRPLLAQIIFPGSEAEEALGYSQFQRYIPIKLRAE